MKIVKKFDKSQPKMIANFYLDVYGKNQYFLVKAMLNYIPKCSRSDRIRKQLMFFLLDPVLCDNGEICLESLVYDTIANIGEFTKKFLDEDDLREMFLNVFKQIKLINIINKIKEFYNV